MALHVLPELIQGSDEWLEQRRGMVTASVVGQLITPKTDGLIDGGVLPDDDDKHITERVWRSSITGHRGLTQVTLSLEAMDAT